MSSGGRRNRSGPPADPTSKRSEARGVKLTALPAKGYAGPVPAFPLPPRPVYYFTKDEDGRKVRERDDEASQAGAERELELWEWAWRTPQAVAWSQPSEAWRLHTIAMWVRTYVVCESAEATAADKGALHRFADQIGMTPAGLRENGWAIAVDEVAAKAADRTARAGDAAATARPARRLRPVAGEGRE